MKFYIFVLFCSVLIANSYCKSDTEKVSKKGNSGDAAGRAKLRKKIFDDYDKMNIPDDVTVKFSIVLLSLDVNEEKSTLEADAWLKYTWMDSRLKWDNTTNKINVLRVGSQEIWKPDITLYNSANLKDMLSCWDSNPVLYPNGQVIWIPPCQIYSNCNFTLDKQPYGEQKCSLKFGSWTYDSNIMDMEFYEGKKEADLDLFGSTEWKIIDNKATRTEKFYPCCEEPYTDITYDFVIQRYEYFTCKHNDL